MELIPDIALVSKQSKASLDLCKKKYGRETHDFLFSSHLLTVLHAQIVVFDVEVNVRQDQLMGRAK